MKSKWYALKQMAIRLRRKGHSIRSIEGRLGIPRSTLSGWFRSIQLSPKLRQRLHRNWLNALVSARKKAVLWHNRQKEQRMRKAQEAAVRVLNNLNIKDPNILELALALLYLGEGSKKKIGTEMGSSDPLILKFFLSIVP